MADRPLVIVSNRGPLSFQQDDSGELTARRGAGGLVSGLAPLVAGTGATWMAAAMSDADRAAAARGTVEAEGLRARLLNIHPVPYDLAYNVVSNQVLWFIHHGLYDLVRAPAFTSSFDAAWAAYRDVNAVFADALATEAAENAIVLVQDYHLCLIAKLLGDRRPDLTLVHFAHTPFAPPDWLRVLPGSVRDELLDGLAAYHACGFHTQRWADDYLASCQALSPTPPPHTFVSPLPADVADVRQAASSAACNEALADLTDVAGDRTVIARVDRIELSKNIVRGFLAFNDLLERYPEWREQVVFLASVYPSRGGVPDYERYQAAVAETVEKVNQQWGTDSWTPIVYDTTDNYPRSVAVLRRADVLLVNPLRDGLNLVAKEAAIVNERNAVLCLSPEAGVWAELGDAALAVHPFDVAGTADVLSTALAMPPEERHKHAEALRQRAGARQPADWLTDQLTAASAAR